MKLLFVIASLGLMLGGCASSSKEETSTTTATTPVATQTTHATTAQNTMPSLPPGSYLQFPKNVEPGQCFAKIQVPARYEYKMQRVMVKPASKTLATVPAQYQFVNQEVLIKESTQKLSVIPAKYKTIKERIMIAEEKKVLKTIPATYAATKERILIRPARKVWKVGREWKDGSIATKYGKSGEIRCLIEEPAVYKTITKRVVKTPARTVTVIVPAKYKVIEKVVLDQPARTIATEIPAVKKSIKVKKMVEPARTITNEAPAVYKNMKTKVAVSEPYEMWTQILCRTNDDNQSGVVRKLQAKLKDMKYYRGTVDGVIGPGTHRAIHMYQKNQQKKSYYNGRITYDTLRNMSII